MALPTVGRGRPCAVAEIPFSNARKVDLIEEFYRVCSTFHYPDIMAVSRGLRVSRNTVERWKYGLSLPRTWDIAIDVIEWVKLGKPKRYVPPSLGKMY